MRNRFYIILWGMVLFGILRAHGQSMSMQMPGMPKNFYLLMMDTMMNKMAAIPYPVSVESDFNQQMIAHHEGAIDMARYEIGHGKDFSMIQLAKSIMTEQMIEIQQMHLWLKKIATKKIIPNWYSQNMKHSMNEMMNSMPADSNLSDPDRAFAMVMIPHHLAAVAMAKAVINYSDDQQMIRFSKQLISNEEIEIEQMSAFLK